MIELVRDRTNPMILDYRMNAGYIPSDHWVHGVEGGGRNIGEACHIYDLFTALTGARVSSVSAQAIRPSTGFYRPNDNFVATMAFDDGSVGTLTYTALGHQAHPKERLDIYFDGAVLSVDEYKRLDVAGRRAGGLALRRSDKGHRAELEALAKAIRAGGPWPIPLWEQAQATDIAIAVEPALSTTRQ
jgi:predicted dehydrogenase